VEAVTASTPAADTKSVDPASPATAAALPMAEARRRKRKPADPKSLGLPLAGDPPAGPKA
jgi:hypothetical protein